MFSLIFKSLPKQNALIYAYALCMLLCFFARNVLNVNIPVATFLLISLFPIFWGNNSLIIAVGLSCIPFSTGFQYKYTLFFCIIALILKNKHKMRLSKFVWYVLFLMVWEIFHCIYGNFSILEFFRTFAELMFFAAVTCVDLDDVDVKVIFRTFSISVVGVCVVMFYMQMQKYGVDLFSALVRTGSKFRFGRGNSDALNYGLNFNENGLGLICNFSLVLNFILIERREYNKLDMILLILSALFGLATLSRTFVFCLLFFVMLYTFFSGKGVFRRFLFVIFVCFALFFIITNFFPDMVLNFSNRLEDSDLTNGRGDLFVFYMNHIISSPQYFFFGIGLQKFHEKICLINGSFVNVCHNGQEEVWVVWGIVGFVVFWKMIFDIFLLSYRRDNQKIILRSSPFIILLVDSLAGQFVRSGSMMLSLVLAYISMEVKFPNRRI